MSKRVRIAHFSAGASSAVASIIGKADALLYAETRSEHTDNERFAGEIAAYLGLPLIRVGSDKYRDTWDVWERRRFLANRHGAPCTQELKLKPLRAYERLPNAVHIFGYHAGEAHRARRLQAVKPDLAVECPLIDAGITAAGALGFLESIGIDPPITYSLGLPHANCIPCPKATSPGYWAAIRQHFPAEFARMAALERELAVGGKICGLVRIKGERRPLAELPVEVLPRLADAPSCDMLCEAARAAA